MCSVCTRHTVTTCTPCVYSVYVLRVCTPCMYSVVYVLVLMGVVSYWTVGDLLQNQ